MQKEKTLTQKTNLYFPDSYDMSYLASTITGELSGLPNMLIQVGSAETMLDDSRRFYKKAKKANVNAKLEIWEDMFHGWHSNAHILKDAEDAIISIGKFCRKLLKISEKFKL